MVLLIRRSMDLSENTFLIAPPKLVERHQKLKVRSFYNTLGPNVAKSLPALHALSGKVEGIGKTAWFKTLLRSNDDTITALCH